MDTVYLIAFALIALVVIYYMFFTKKETDNEFQRDDSMTNNSKELSIENVGIGGKLSISNFGKNSDFLNVTIHNKKTHQEDDNFWYELEGRTSRGDDFWLQIESIEPLILNGGTERISFNDLGISTNDLENLRAEDKAFQLNDEQYFFDTNGEVKVYDDLNSSDEEEEEDFSWCRYWEFSNESEKVFISIDQFENGSPEASIAYPILANQLRIFELGNDAR